MSPQDEKSLSDEATRQGGGHSRKEEVSLGDRSTFGGGDASSVSDLSGFGDLPDHEMEIVDLSGRYKLEETLGQGGMGEVQLATDTRLDRKVAIKRIRGDGATSKVAVARFLTEAKAIAALNHPNVVQVYDYGRDESGPFLLGVYEVTQEQYEKVMGANPSKFQGSQNPVEMVSWDDAVEFCQKLSELPQEKVAGHVYRLPTEAEWEFACRAETATKFSFGDDESQLGECAWFQDNSGSKTHPVGKKKPNAWGLYDMHGNGWEWCQDWYGYGEYASVAVTDPTGASTGSNRVFRGGCWNNPAGYCRSSNRCRAYPSLRDYYRGFRVAMVPSSQPSK